jgi:hypothetical protein
MHEDVFGSRKKHFRETGIFNLGLKSEGNTSLPSPLSTRERGLIHLTLSNCLTRIFKSSCIYSIDRVVVLSSVERVRLRCKRSINSFSYNL